MDPAALSAGIFESDMYYLVLCHIRKSPLLRIWTHLVCLEKIGGGMPHGPNLFFRALGLFCVQGKKSEGFRLIANKLTSDF